VKAEQLIALRNNDEKALALPFELELFGLPYEEFSKLSNNQQKKFFDYMRSDHAVFWEHDIPAILLTDTGKTNYQCAHVNLYMNQI
jgi:hypothetical protein